MSRSVRLAAALLGLAPVGALLAWVMGYGTFRSWFVAVSIPATVALAGLAAWLAFWGDVEGRDRRLRLAVVAGFWGGLAGTIGYDVFRIPFVITGLRLFAPIDSYGLLALGADASSPWTGLIGWAFHFTNGIGFGIAYAVAALGRRWPWAVAWGMVLETATILTPFAATYAIAGQWDLIAIAYAAHVAYGVPLGLICQRAVAWAPRRPTAIPASLGVAAVVGGLFFWHHPWTTSADVRAGHAAAAGPSAVVRGGRFRPEWLRVAPGGCAIIRNDDDIAYTLPGGPALSADGGRARLCIDEPGAHRVRLGPRPYSGGFVLVDRAMSR